METSYLNSYTESVEEFENAFSYILPGTQIETKIKNPGFSSEGYGLLSEGFYLGENLTKNLLKLKISNPNAVVFQIPLRGHYTARVSKSASLKCTPERGCLILPTNMFEYTSDVEEINDMFIVVNYDDIYQILENKFQPNTNEQFFFSVDKENPKTAVVYNLLVNNLQAIKTYPHLQSSVHFVESVKETAILFLVEVLSDLLNLKLKTISSSDERLIENVEKLIISRPESFFNINHIAKKSNTSTRKLQLLFKEHRNCSPMQFLKRRKLIKAKAMITKAHEKPLIKQVAIDSGFTNLSTFSRDYKKLFGELPSTTIKKSFNSR